MEERFKDWETPIIEHGKLTKWNWMVQHPENLKLGKKVDIGAFVYINSKYGVEIQDNVQIGGGVKIYSLDTIGNKKGRVILKKNCKIGSNSVIMPGVTIGENSIVGALSFLNTNVPDNVIVAGSPVKLIKRL